MIEVENISKRYGEKLAVDGLDFVVRPGIVTGFLGPNGAGKSTTMRMIAGLDEPTAGRVRVNGKDYRAASAPMAELGILLEAKAVHTGRSARNHLLALAQTNGVSRRRVDEVIGMAGLDDVAGKRVGGFSLGMGQRQQVIAGRPTGVHRLGLQQDAQLGHRGGRGTVVLAVDPDPAGGGLVQAGDHPHHGRFASPVRAEKASHDTGPDNKVQAVDRKLLPVSLADVLYLDHLMFLSSMVFWHHQR